MINETEPTRAEIMALSPEQLRLRVALMMEPKPPLHSLDVLRSMCRDDWRYSWCYMQSTGRWWRIEIGLDAPAQPEWESAQEPDAEISAAWLVHKKSAFGPSCVLYYQELAIAASEHVADSQTDVLEWPYCLAWVEPSDIIRAALLARRDAE